MYNCGLDTSFLNSQTSGKTLLALTWLSWLCCLKWYFRQLKDNLRHLSHLSQVKAKSVFPDEGWPPCTYKAFHGPTSTVGPWKVLMIGVQEIKNIRSTASVKMHFGFQRFLNPGNLWKPVKTQELGNLDTYVPFPRNLTNLYSMQTSETQQY